jgi:hypothetical protein
MSEYRLFVNRERTVLVRVWASGDIEVSLRDDPGAIWSPPIEMTEEQT